MKTKKNRRRCRRALVRRRRLIDAGAKISKVFGDGLSREGKLKFGILARRMGISINRPMIYSGGRLSGKTFKAENTIAILQSSYMGLLGTQAGESFRKMLEALPSTTEVVEALGRAARSGATIHDTLYMLKPKKSTKISPPFYSKKDKPDKEFYWDGKRR